MSRASIAANLVATVSIDGSRLREVLRAEGFEPPDNICASCGHQGFEHDLGNWCLLCPRPDDWDRRAPSPTGAKVRAGWCFFGSMTEDERWDRSMARIVAALRPTQEEVR